MIERSQVDSPLGSIAVAVKAGGLCALHLGALDELVFAAEPVRTVRMPPKEIAQALDAYFAGDLTAIDELPVASDGTEFQRKVWAKLRTIKAGTTWTYAQLAQSIGQPAAVRAVGAANGRNPIAIVVPCHRVIASDGKLHGYAGGLERKQWLLRHEGAWPMQKPMP